MTPDTIYIVIPAYNEATVIQDTIRGLKDFGYHNIVVVDDCSNDKTSEKSKGVGAMVLSHSINRGYGAALRTGMEYIRAYTNASIVVTFDADGQHRPEDIKKLTTPIYRNECDIVLGSRFLGSADNISIFRKYILRLAIMFTSITSGIHLSDAHNGLRALNRNAIKRIQTYCRGMEYSSEIIDEIRRNKLRFKEVPVKILYSEYSMRKGQKTSGFIKLGFRIVFKKILKYN